MIAGGLPTRVYYVSLGGFDTHANERGRHDNLMQQLASGVSAFFADLKGQGNDAYYVRLWDWIWDNQEQLGSSKSQVLREVYNKYFVRKEGGDNPLYGMVKDAYFGRASTSADASGCQWPCRADGRKERLRNGQGFRAALSRARRRGHIHLRARFLSS